MISISTAFRTNLQLTLLFMSIVSLPFSTAICNAAIIGLVLTWLTEARWNDKLEIIRRSLILQLTIALFIWQAIGLMFTSQAQTGFVEIQRKLPLLLLPLVMATSTTRLSARNIQLLMWTFVAACTVAAIICLGAASLQSLDVGSNAAKIGYLNSSDMIDAKQIATPWLYFSYVNLAAAINIHPAYLSLLIGFALVVIVNELLKRNFEVRRSSILLIGLLLMLALFEVFLATRIVIIALLFMGGLGIVISFRRHALRLSMTLSIVLPLSLMALWLNPVSYYRSIHELSNSNFDIRENYNYKTSAEIRASLWWLSWQAVSDINLLTGAGTGSVKEKIHEQGQRHNIDNVLGTFDPHNQYFYYLIGNGAIGLLIFLAMLALPVLVAVRVEDFLYVSFATLCASLFLTESALEVQKGISFFAIIGSLLAFQRQSFQDFKFQVTNSRADI